MLNEAAITAAQWPYTPTGDPVLMGLYEEGSYQPTGVELRLHRVIPKFFGRSLVALHESRLDQLTIFTAFHRLDVTGAVDEFAVGRSTDRLRGPGLESSAHLGHIKTRLELNELETAPWWVIDLKAVMR